MSPRRLRQFSDNLNSSFKPTTLVMPSQKAFCADGVDRSQQKKATCTFRVHSKLGHEAGLRINIARSIQLSVFDILQGCAID